MWTAQGRSRHPQVRVSQLDNDREADHSKCCLLLTPKTRWLFQAWCQTYVSICSEFDTQFSLVKYLTAATCSNPPQPPCLSDTATPTQLCLYLHVPISWPTLDSVPSSEPPCPWLPSYSQTCLWPVLNLTSLCLQLLKLQPPSRNLPSTCCCDPTNLFLKLRAEGRARSCWPVWWVKDSTLCHEGCNQTKPGSINPGELRIYSSGWCLLSPVALILQTTATIQDRITSRLY